MSQRPIALSPDLKRLKEEGYEVYIASQHLAVSGIPYVNSSREVRRGTLYAPLNLSGDITTRPESHVVFFAGDHPCDNQGVDLLPLKHSSENKTLAADIMVNHSFSNKPLKGFENYYDLVTSYIRIISSHAESLEPNATARTGVVTSREENDAFNYLDTHSARCEITAISDKLAVQRIAIIGLGGTGSYILDLLAKTPVSEIHLFDSDVFSQHNAFRSPGAPTIEQLRQIPTKVAYLSGIYLAMRKSIKQHPYRVDASNLQELLAMNFVFISIDDGEARKLIGEYLMKAGVPFVDVGMGLRSTDGHIGGAVRSTAISAAKQDHFTRRVPVDPANDGVYNTNIQVSELNALNAVLAVIAWKKTIGFYEDLDCAHHVTYTIGANLILNEENAISTTAC